MPYLELLQHNPVLYVTLVVILGLLVGSFLNVVIYRLPVMLKQQWRADCLTFLELDDSCSAKQSEEIPPFNLVVPRSRCPVCGHQITALENIPVISYLFLRGKCQSCKTPISIRYPFIELLSAILAAVTAWKFGVTIEAAAAVFLTWTLITLTFIDFDHQYLPDNITLPLLWAGLGLNLFNTFTDLGSAVIGAMAGYLILWTVYHIFKRLTGKEGMGYGDFKLLAVFGAWLGWQALPVTILLSTLVGSVIGILLVLFKRHDRSQPIPFGPYLAIAGWISLLWGNEIISTYLAWISP